jgi:hypothetical protein
LGRIGAVLLGCGLWLLASVPAQAAPAWLPTVDLSAPGRDAAGARLAMAESGETVAVWARQNGVSGFGVQASVRSTGAPFGAPVDLAANAFDPDVAIAPSGEAVAAWRRFDAGTGSYVIQAATHPPGGGFSAPVDVSVSDTAAQPQEIQVAVNRAGAAAIVWRQKDPGSAVDPDQFSILASFRPPGGAFSAPVLVSPAPVDAETEAGSPRIAVDLNGDTVVVWSFDTGAESVVEGAIRPAGGIVGAPARISAAGESALSPAIAAPPVTGTDFTTPTSGAATVAWVRSDGTDFIAEAATASSVAGFSTPVPLSAPGADAGTPTVAAADAENVRVAWVRWDGSNYRVEAASGGGASFSPPQLLSAPGASAFEPALAAGPAGSAAVAWKRSNGPNEIVEAALAPAGGGFAAPVQLSAAGQSATSPAAAMDGPGDATVTWLRSDGANQIVQAAGYDAAPPVFAGVSIPATGTVGVPVAFSASPFDVWPIVSTSFGFGDGGAAGGASVSHAYSAPGTYLVTVTASDAAGTAVAASGAIVIRPSNQFSIGKLALNKKKGTATLTLVVPGPGRLVLSGKGIKRAVAQATQAGSVKMPVRAVGKTRKKLAKRGRVKVRLAIAYTPDGGEALVKGRTAKLIKKLPRAAS